MPTRDLYQSHVPAWTGLLTESCLACAGKLHFVKFETSQVQQCMDFIQAKGLHHHWAQHSDASPRPTRVKATGGGAFKYAELFEVNVALAAELVLK